MVALVLGNLWFTLARSSIPVGFAGRVDSIEVLTEKKPGIDDVYVVRIGVEGLVLGPAVPYPAQFHADEAVASDLVEGEIYTKERWDSCITALSTPTVPECTPVTPSKDFWGMVAAMPVVLLTGIVILIRRRAPRTERS